MVVVGVGVGVVVVVAVGVVVGVGVGVAVAVVVGVAVAVVVGVAVAVVVVVGVAVGVGVGVVVAVGVVSYTTDKLYGRQGGRIVQGPITTHDGPPCNICSSPMIAGQKHRHAVCSPPMPCCDYPSDLVQNKAKHTADHKPAG